MAEPSIWRYLWVRRHAPAWLAELCERLEAAEARVAELQISLDASDEFLRAAKADLMNAFDKGAADERAVVVAYLRGHPSEELRDARYWSHHWAGLIEAGAHRKAEP